MDASEIKGPLYLRGKRVWFTGEAFFYVLSSRLFPGFVKIGITQDPAKRLGHYYASTPRVGQYFTYELLVDCPRGNLNPDQVERWVLSRFEKQRVPGTEWLYGITIPQIVKAISVYKSVRILEKSEWPKGCGGNEEHS